MKAKLVLPWLSANSRLVPANAVLQVSSSSPSAMRCISAMPSPSDLPGARPALMVALL